MSVTLALFTFTSSRSTPFATVVSRLEMLLLAPVVSWPPSGCAASAGDSEAPLAVFRPRTDMGFVTGL